MTRLMARTFAVTCFIILHSHLAVAQDIPLVRYTTSATNLAGNPIDTIRPNTEFDLTVFVQDIRDNAFGVFSAYVDVFFDSDLFTALGPIIHSSTYSAGLSGDILTPGLIDEAGGTDGFSPLGGDVYEVLRVRMTSNDELGKGVFEMDPADDLILHPTTVFLAPPRALTADEIVFVSSDLTVVPELAANQMLILLLPFACAIVRRSQRRPS